MTPMRGFSKPTHGSRLHHIHSSQSFSPNAAASAAAMMSSLDKSLG